MAKGLKADRKVRIIGGEWRSRQLSFPANDAIRPTPDRVRETLFNWLQGDVANARCLEPFAGSGALSFEALSRGANYCLMLDQDKATCDALRDNLQILGAEKTHYRVEQRDAFDWHTSPPEQAFDLIFLDPPFAIEIEQFLPAVLASGVVAPEAFIYIETARAIDVSDIPADVEILRQKKAGAVHFALLQTHMQ